MLTAKEKVDDDDIETRASDANISIDFSSTTQSVAGEERPEGSVSNLHGTNSCEWGSNWKNIDVYS